MKKRLVIMSLLVLSLGTVSASRVKSLSQPAAPKDENKKEQMAKPAEMKAEKPIKPAKVAKVKMAKPAKVKKEKAVKVKMAKPAKMKSVKSVKVAKPKKVKMAKPAKMQQDMPAKPAKVKKEKVAKHQEQEQVGHDIPSLVAHRNELIQDIDAAKSEIHEKLEDAHCINYDMNLAARKKYRADKKHMNDQINELRLEARKAGSEHREKDQKDLHTTIENLQGFGTRPEAQAKHDALPALREELESLRKDQRDTINKLKAQCKKEHVRYEPAKRVKVKKMKMVQEPKVKQEKVAKPAKMKKAKMAKPAKMKKEKVAKVKMAKPAKAKKAKMAKPAKAVKPVMAKPAKVKKEKKSAHFRMYSHEKIQEKSEDNLNNAGSNKRKRFSSAKEEDGSMSLEKPMKKSKKPAAVKMQKPMNKMKNADEIMEMPMQK